MLAGLVTWVWLKDRNKQHWDFETKLIQYQNSIKTNLYIGVVCPSLNQSRRAILSSGGCAISQGINTTPPWTPVTVDTEKQIMKKNRYSLLKQHKTSYWKLHKSLYSRLTKLEKSFSLKTDWKFFSIWSNIESFGNLRILGVNFDNKTFIWTPLAKSFIIRLKKELIFFASAVVHLLMIQLLLLEGAHGHVVR